MKTTILFTVLAVTLRGALAQSTKAPRADAEIRQTIIKNSPSPAIKEVVRACTTSIVRVECAAVAARTANPVARRRLATRKMSRQKMVDEYRKKTGQ